MRSRSCGPAARSGWSSRATDPPSPRSSSGRASVGVAGSFEWLGLVTERARIAALVRAADVCVAPEIDSDFNRLATFVKIIEYMSAGAAVVAHRLPQTEALAGDTIRYAADMTAEGLAAAIDGSAWMRPRDGARWGTRPAGDSTSGSAGSESARPGWSPATSGCSAAGVTA